MRRTLFRRPSPAMIVAFIALMAALAPTAAALKGVNLVSSNDIITGAVKKSDAGRDSVGVSEALEDNDKGGGFTGQQIDEAKLGTVPSASALARVALIDADGRIVRSNGVRATRRVEAGVFEVTFDRDVRTCHFLATLSGRDSGQITVEEPTTNSNAVTVHTFEGGAPTDRAFHLAVSC